jgi:hypothetical protein
LVSSSPGVVARRADQRHRELAALGRREVERDRALALVEADQNRLVPSGATGQRRWSRPPPSVSMPDHVGAELRQGHAAERRGDERAASTMRRPARIGSSVIGRRPSPARPRTPGASSSRPARDDLQRERLLGAFEDRQHRASTK